MGNYRNFRYPEPTAPVRDGADDVKRLAYDVGSRFNDTASLRPGFFVRRGSYTSNTGALIDVDTTGALASLVGAVAIVESSGNVTSCRINQLVTGQVRVQIRNNDGSQAASTAVVLNVIAWGSVITPPV